MTEFNAAERKHVRQAEKSAKADDRELGAYTASIMATAPGRKWMCYLLESCHVFGSSFNSNSMQMAFAEGERNVGLRLLAGIMQYCPEDYVTMMMEKNGVEHARSSNRRTAAEPESIPEPDSDSAEPDPLTEWNRNSVRYG